MTTTMQERYAFFDDLDRPNELVNSTHRTAWHFDIASQNTIMVTRTGSVMYGVNQDSSDNDFTGVCVEPPEVALGITPSKAQSFEQFIYSTAAVDQKTPPGGTDVTVYGLKKFIYLCAKGDPNAMALLFSPRDTRVIDSLWWSNVRRTQHLLVSRVSGERYQNYLKKQVAKNLTYDQTSRPELVEKYGWDTKAGYHALRIAYQGYELMRKGYIEYPMITPIRELLIAVRGGEYSKSECLRLIDARAHDMQLATERSQLPEEPNYPQINAWMSKFYRDYWDEQEFWSPQKA